MTQANYPRCLANTLNEEGSYSNDPRDPGGPTMRGIIQREYTAYRARRGLPSQSVHDISEVELQDIYAGNYWKPMSGDRWPKGLDQIVFDIAVNSGIGRAPRIMAEVLGTDDLRSQALAARATVSVDQVGLIKRACARRASFYRALGTFAVFGRGWLARNARMEAIGVRMCLEAQGVKDIPGALKHESTGAALEAKRAKHGATATGSGTMAGGAAVTQAHSWDWSVWLALGLTAIGAIALTLVLIWIWQKHGERAKAYAAAIEGTVESTLADVLLKIRRSN